MGAKDIGRGGDGEALGWFGGGDSFVVGDDGGCTADGGGSLLSLGRFPVGGYANGYKTTNARLEDFAGTINKQRWRN